LDDVEQILAITPFFKVLKYLNEPFTELPADSKLPLIDGLIVIVLGYERDEFILLGWVFGRV
jgi:hypothetical protein